MKTQEKVLKVTISTTFSNGGKYTGHTYVLNNSRIGEIIRDNLHHHGVKLLLRHRDTPMVHTRKTDKGWQAVFHLSVPASVRDTLIKESFLDGMSTIGQSVVVDVDVQ